MNAPVSTSEDLIYSVADGIARITFNRPQARNALTFAMYEQMAEICENANADRSIKAIILTGTGDKAFASGTDISQFRAFKTAQDSLDYEARIDRVLGTLEQVRVPTIAAIAGACTGGGAGIAACCDSRIGTEATRIGFPIARTLGNQFQQPHPPGVAVAVFFKTEKVAIGGASIDPYQHGVAALEDLVVSADLDAGQVLGRVGPPRRRDGQAARRSRADHARSHQGSGAPHPTNAVAR